MLNIRKILFPTDFSETSTHALTYALYLARRYHAELHMLHVTVFLSEDPHNPAHHFPDREAIYEKLREIAERDMEAQIPEGEDEGLTIVRAQRRNLSAAPSIVDYAAEEDIDLIVMGTHGRHGLPRILIGSVAEEVIRHAPCPVLAIRKPEDTEAPVEVKRILVPIDFSEHSREALTVAREIAETYDAAVQLVHVLEEVIHPAFYGIAAKSLHDIYPHIEEEAVEAMMRFFAETDGPEVPVTYHVFEGRAGRDIPRFAEEHESDLIVISTHGLTGLDHLLIGSVAERVVRRAPCPVLVLKSFRRSLLPQNED